MSDQFISLNFHHVKWLLIVSYLATLVIDNMMSLAFANHFLPSITLLLLLHWVTQILNQTHLFTAFILGLLFDASLATPLGSHALIFTTLTFLMLRARQRFKSYPLWQQALIIGTYFVLAQIMSWFIFNPSLVDIQYFYFWLEPLAAILLWPIIDAAMKASTQKFAYL